MFDCPAKMKTRKVFLSAPDFCGAALRYTTAGSNKNIRAMWVYFMVISKNHVYATFAIVSELAKPVTSLVSDDAKVFGER